MAEEARAEHVIGAPASDRPEDPLEVGRVVLTVAVEVDGGGVALVPRDAEPGAKRRPEPARDRVRMDAGAMLAGDARRAIARAVVDDEHVDGQTARLPGNAGEHTADGPFLVARNDDGEAPRGGPRHRGPGSRRIRFHGCCPA
jgi:hypothetical protein